MLGPGLSGWFNRWFRSPNGLSPAAVRFDLHNHILPGVDDGAPDLEHALGIIQAMVDLGYKGAVVTPHIQPEVFENTEEALAESFRLFEPIAHAHFKGMFRLALGAEYYLDNQLMDSLWNRPDDLLRFGPDRSLLLIEFPTISLPTFVPDLLGACRRAKITPVIAHPERYADIHFDHKHENVRAWRDGGALIQVNLGSLVGQYGSTVRACANALGNHGLVDLVGTDLHRPSQAPHYTVPAWDALAHSRWKFDPARQQGLFSPG
ncbi:MAG: protein tyrosine phosphatase [Planctomycetota bacterium]|nr:protein tyrosine phosphatase [Planctomycetota bacterium]